MSALVIVVGLIGLGFAWWLKNDVLSEDCGTPKMQEISAAIEEGAEAYMARQCRAVCWLTVASALVILLIHAADDGRWHAGLTVALSFVGGAVFSLASGYTGTRVAIRVNGRAAAAARTSLNRALKVALRGGAVAGIAVVAFSLLGMTAAYLLAGADPSKTPYE
ncbi:MAG: sodium/proton-translocating pyrophosphatase, partial [Candidatus Riflebacteria bacterium]|nr:sodium/proton-translocating pyrophosphatase [Candidatus Riflebacteria bacterium]